MIQAHMVTVYQSEVLATRPLRIDAGLAEVRKASYLNVLRR
jgi:hypothetical protein